MYKRVAELGWLGVAIPTEFGGSGGGLVDLCLFLEEISRGQVPIGGFSVSAISAGPYERFGTDEQKQEILTGIVGGAVEAIAMSEPEAGSDVGNLRCKAERRNGGYVINGQKTWISEAQHAEHILLVCRTEAGSRQAQGADDAVGSRRLPTGSRSAASRRWAARSSTTCSSTTARSRPTASSASKARPGCS